MATERAHSKRFTFKTCVGVVEIIRKHGILRVSWRFPTRHQRAVARNEKHWFWEPSAFPPFLCSSIVECWGKPIESYTLEGQHRFDVFLLRRLRQGTRNIVDLQNVVARNNTSL